MDKTMTLDSLFDGSGGFPLGAILTGIEPLWASEVEPFPIRVTTKRFPSMRHLGDINKVNGAEIPPVDIITAGFCCQDLSVAGKRAGLSGARSGLFYQIPRIIKEMLAATDNVYPKYAILENVPYVRNSIRNILPQRASWVSAIRGPPHFKYDAQSLGEKAAAFAAKPGPAACGRQILAG